MIDNRLLEIISNETKEEVCRRDFVTPEMFASIFMENAKKHKMDIDHDEFEKYIDQKVNDYLRIQDRTSQQADKLSDTTSKALAALKDKDDEALKEVYKETKLLRYEIEKLKESLYKDELTGVYNRKWLYDTQLENNGFQKNGVIAVIDLNYFKIINDTYGHIIGDKVLIFIANQLKKSKGKVVRYGGDEFLILFEDTQKVDEIKRRLNGLREDILKKHLKAKDAEFKVSFSFGVTQFDKGENLENVIDKADEAMYDDKIEIKKRVKGIDI